MVVGSVQFPQMHPVSGFRLGTVEAGIRYAGRRDLVVMELCEGSRLAAVFTSNAFCAAPVTICREHLDKSTPRYLVTNTGNANAGTGRQGYEDAKACCQAMADIAGCSTEQVLPFSTGVIGESLPVERITAGLPAAFEGLSEDGWEDAGWGILTTDTVPKGASVQVPMGDRMITISGITKGSGMIRPDMATMLAYLATDAELPDELLQACLHDAVDASFNRITVDGDTSTNDSCVLVATGRSGVAITDVNGDDYHRFCRAVTEICEALAQAIVRDGEGATKLITIDVTGARDEDEAARVAYTVAHSPLVKTAFFAGDPNWGRILAAVGRAGVDGLDLDALTIHLDDVCIVSQGGRDAAYEESLGQAVMQRDEIGIVIDLKRGGAHTRVWTCDFSYDYVKINAEYRS
ncbi:MAG: bifunctional glutamate N-acetyltransferase/amino-acid acetyltransferase ArgJ [Gammaproteobacteria bacterium]|nr:bifunctional glutamate N-acetyltransferase/amino-acid acetyltransferase ArgJ [Gammaproteobacteria bacterium]